MKKIKDRTIRIENLNNDDVLIAMYSEGLRRLFTTLALISSAIIIITGKFMYSFIPVIFITVSLLIKPKLIVNVFSDRIVHYIDVHFATVIYFEEIINVQLKNQDKDQILVVLLDDNTEYEILIPTNNDEKVDELKVLVGDKYVEK